MIQLQDCRTPEEIQARSFEMIDALFPQPRPFSGDAWEIARRLIHTTGDPDLARDMILPDMAVQAGTGALLNGAPVYTDTNMVKAGIPLYRLNPLGCAVACILDLPGVDEAAKQHGTTRTRAAMTIIADRLDGAIVAIGNAPTALLALLEETSRLGARPALVVGMPVGFVNAAESKELLLERTDLPSLVIRGRRGGSPLASATINALACMALERRG